MSEKIVTVGGQQLEIALERQGERFHSGQLEIEIVALRSDEIELRVDGHTHVVPYAISGSTVSFSFDGEIWFADVTDKGARTRTRHRDHSTSAPMPGLVLKILVQPGDVVSRGAPLLILEAMKMEHQIIAPRDAVIAAVNCSEGELVQPGIELITLEEDPQP